VTSSEELAASTGHSSLPKLADDLFDFLPDNLSSLEKVQQFSPAALAYLGDVVYELYVRRFYLTPPKRLQTYHRQVVAQVRAETQAKHLHAIKPHLTQAELEMLRRGRNATSSKPRRIDLEIYRQATSFEALIGYLYLTDSDRLAHLLSQLDLTPDVTD
jgi:ribonuclease III family protein